MKVTVFNTKLYERAAFDAAPGARDHELVFIEPRLTAVTATLAARSPAICAFVNDDLSEPVLRRLAAGGTRLVALRSAGFNHVDLRAADALGMTVVRVPAYSPHAVAEHTVGLMLALNRKIHRAHQRVRDANFALDGLMGFDLAGRTAGIIGTGKIGALVARILAGFGMRLLVVDPNENPDCLAAGARYVSLEVLLAESDVITLHCPLTPATHHVIDADAVGRMKDGVMLVNTSRGGLIDTPAVVDGLKSGRIGYLGLDVYEEEGDLFFEDLSDQIIQDDVFSRLQTFPNVLITAHQGFFTQEALSGIVTTTLENLSEFERTGACANAVRAKHRSSRDPRSS